MKRRVVVISAVLVVVLLAGYLGISYVVYDKLSRVTYGGGDDAKNTPASFVNTYEEFAGFNETPYLMPQYETVRIPSRQPGIGLAGWYIPGKAGAPAVVFTHGINGCKCAPNVLTAAGMLHRNGLNVLLFDLRNHGQSDIDNGRTAIGNKEYLDTLGAWDWLIAQKGFEPAQIGLYGQSLGAGTTLIAFGEEPRVAATFVDSPYADLKEIMDEELARNHYPTILADGSVVAAKVVSGDDLLAHSPQEAIDNDAGRPIFIVHGTGDQRINVHHTQQLMSLALQDDANLTTWMPHGVGHVSAEFDLPQEYERRLVAFFNQALASQDP
ncbi:MAG TPA: prolyl oligopeptidase family serine peptidase [Anaerolineales bacterium]|nr:prolyl oligopeptidase family serine peptidase [Anaerolineales bacterium]